MLIVCTVTTISIVIFAIIFSCLETKIHKAIKTIEDAKDRIDEAIYWLKKGKMYKAIKIVLAIPRWTFKFLGNHRTMATAVPDALRYNFSQLAIIREEQGNLKATLIYSGVAAQYQRLQETICLCGFWSMSCCNGPARVRHK